MIRECTNKLLEEVSKNTSNALDVIEHHTDTLIKAAMKAVDAFEEVKGYNDGLSDYIEFLGEKINTLVNKFQPTDLDNPDLENQLNILGQYINNLLDERDQLRGYIQHLQKELSDKEEKKEHFVAIDELEEKCSNPNLDKIPPYAKIGRSKCTEYKEKLPIAQCRLYINGKEMEGIENQVKMLLEQSGLEYCSLDEFYKKVLEVFDELQK